MTEATTIRLAITLGCLSGAYGLSRRWWIGAMAGALAWTHPDHGTIAISISLAIFAMSVLFSHHRAPQHPQSDDVIDVEFEVTHDRP